MFYITIKCLIRLLTIIDSHLSRSQLILSGLYFVQLLVEIAAAARHNSDIGIRVVHISIYINSY